MAEPETGPVRLYYDGRCGMCRRFRDLVLRLDDRNLVEAVPLQDAHQRGDHLGLDADRFWSQFHVELPDGTVRSGGDALAPLLARLPATRPAAGLLRRVPPARWTAAALYRLAVRLHGGPAEPWEEGGPGGGDP